MATPERDPRSKPTLADLMMIDLMQADVDYSRFLPNVDLNVPREVKRLHRKDSRRWLPRMIAERARLYCEQVKHWQPDDIDRWLAWLAVLFSTFTVVVVAAVAVLHALGTTDWLFSADENEASISGLMWLIVIPPLLCLPSLVGSLMLLFRRRSRAGDGPWWIDALKYFTIPGVMFALIRAWSTIRGKNKSIGERAMHQFTEEKSHIVTTIFLAVSNAFMLLLSVAAFLAVVHFLLFNEVRYTWKSSLLNADTKVAVIRSIAGVVPLVQPPSDVAIEWAFGSGEPPAGAEDLRAEWSNFVVRSMVVLTIMPRALIGLLSLVLLRRAWRELLPDPSDPDIDQIVDNIVSRNVTSSTETVSPEIDSASAAERARPQRAQRGVDGPAASKDRSSDEAAGNAAAVASSDFAGPHPPEQASSLPAAEDASAEDAAAAETAPTVPTDWQLIGYGLRPADVERVRQLPGCGRWPTAEVDGAAARRQVATAVAENANIGRVLVIVRATMVPDAAFTRFLAEIHQTMEQRNGEVVLLLSGGSEHLERVDGDAARHRDRMKRWELAVKSVLESKTRIHVAEVAEADACLGPAPDRPAALVFANKYERALLLVEREIQAALKDHDGTLTSEQWNAVSDSIRAQLLQMYEEEYSRFVGSDLVRGCQKRLDELPLELPEGWADKGKEAMAQGVAAYRYLGSLLSPKWLVPGAVVGIGAAGVAPFLAGGAPLLLTVLPSILPSGALTGALGGAAAKHWWSRKRSPEEPSEAADEEETFHGLDMDAAVRSLLLLIVILELQGNDQHRTADVVERRLGAATAHSIVTVDEMREAIRLLEAGLTAERESQRER